ncbi:G patch domain-containing protein 11-like [Schistocerca piceifrons]|uniref:G patch domain-containing protein 11-like n=1 Tax=Schistocerca piceifrons TaxID=274613 RepID=UPI001F5F51F7|nr:G patch domain-containing protein 11-like [Schistocerca piceifrons]XP_049949800.1 G patch domain-containing protein 11 [Schistocerca serialis cubense]
MASDDVDYMSDDILVQCEQQDIRPGLILNHSQKRSHTKYKQKLVKDAENKKIFPRKSVLEEERRDEGLKEAISSDNKGFALLQKMGYKPGSAIGKSGSGIVEPVPIAVKTNRGGLGREAALKEIKEQKLAIKARLLKHRNQLNDIESYRSQMTRKMEERQNEADLRKSQRICEQLDKRKDIDIPAEPWFWPDGWSQEEENESDEEEEEEEECDGDEEEEEESSEEITFQTPEKLEIITLYLRRTYHYCIWCGTEFDDEKDMQQNCPGSTRADH